MATAVFDQTCCTLMPPSESFMPCKDPSSHPAVSFVSSRDTTTAVTAAFAFLSLGHLVPVVVYYRHQNRRMRGRGGVGSMVIMMIMMTSSNLLISLKSSTWPQKQASEKRPDGRKQVQKLCVRRSTSTQGNCTTYVPWYTIPYHLQTGEYQQDQESTHGTYVPRKN